MSPWYIISYPHNDQAVGKPSVSHPTKAHIGIENDVIYTFNLGEAGLFKLMGRRHDATEGKVLSFSREPSSYDGIEIHRLLGHSSEQMTRVTAKHVGVELFGKWTSCIDFSKAKERQIAVPKSAGNLLYPQDSATLHGPRRQLAHD